MLGASGASVVVMAPHPDDESIAAGGLIQVALALGARVTVVLLTDGDNNPWPQRVIERRVWIGLRDRERWGQRRRDEARAALAILGIPDSSIRHLGWPDLGLTHCLMTDAAATVSMLRDVFLDAAPTVVILPTLSDRHPDHSAAHVMCCLALSASGSIAQLLSYTIHGTTSAPAIECGIDVHRREQKKRAVGAYHTQLVLSHKRIMAHAERPERFVIDAAIRDGVTSSLERLPWRISRLSAALADVVVVGGNGAWCVAIAAADSVTRDGASPRCVRDNNGQLHLRMPEQLRISSPAFAKLRCRLSSPWIYDRWGWTRLASADSQRR